MPVLAIPNISAGTAGPELDGATTAVETAGARLLDVHSDAIHNRSVLTTSAGPEALMVAMVGLAIACRAIDLTKHRGIHPRVGALDVCPFVPHEVPIEDAIAIAHRAGRAIADEVGVPVFFYGAASTRAETKDLPDIRRGGIEGLSLRMAQGFQPDAGPSRIDPRYGAVLVGARGTLIAFNVWLDTALPTAQAIATKVREPHRIRALGLGIEPDRCQVSMNLIAPDEVGIEEAFHRVEIEASRRGANVVATEIVGVVPERFLPKQDAKAARLLLEPGRSLESALRD